MITKGSSLTYCNLLAVIKLGILHKTKIINIRINNKSLKLLDILVSLRIISYYLFKDIETGQIQIYVHTDASCTYIHKLQIFPNSRSNSKIWSYSKLASVKNNSPGALILLHTNRGLIFSEEALLYKTGGIVVFVY